jgi:hypothetical protein
MLEPVFEASGVLKILIREEAYLLSKFRRRAVCKFFDRLLVKHTMRVPTRLNG